MTVRMMQAYLEHAAEFRDELQTTLLFIGQDPPEVHRRYCTSGLPRSERSNAWTSFVR